MSKTYYTNSELADQITNAIEGGMTDTWADHKDYMWGSENGDHTFGETNRCEVTVRDREGGDWIKVTVQVMRKGFDKIMSGEVEVSPVRQDMLDDNLDADGADAILQVAILGELTYA